MSELGDLFEKMTSNFDADAWGDQDTTMLFDISGDNGGTWTVAIEGGNLTLTEGSVDDADLTRRATDEDMLAIMTGELNGVSAFMQGKLKIEGDMSLAMKLQNLF